MQTKEVIARVIEQVIEHAARLWPGQELKWSLENIYGLSQHYKSNINIDTIRRTLNLLTAEGRMFTVGKVGGITRNPEGGYIIHTDSEAAKPKKLETASIDPDHRTVVVENNDKTMCFAWTVKLADLENIARQLLEVRNNPEKKVVVIRQD